MRDELHLMELVDRYLDGEMGEAERAAFDERIRVSAELHGLVNDQRALREGLHRVQLRGALASAHLGWTIMRMAPWVVAGLVIIAAGAWWVSASAESDAHREDPRPELSEVHERMETDPPAYDPLPEDLDLDTRVETVFTRTAPVALTAVDTCIGEGHVVTRMITQERAPVEGRSAVSAPVQRAEPVPSVPAAALSTTSATWDAEDRFDQADSMGAAFGTATEVDVQKNVLATVERFENATKPEFPGGIEQMQHYIREHVRQPHGTKKVGTVSVGFTVNKKGEVANVEVVRSLGRAFDAEAVRVISTMPQWEPSRIGDRPVKSKLEVRVRFDGAPRTSTAK